MRARFIVFLVVVALVAAFWNDAADRIARLTRPRQAATPAAGDEFFCPMHPSVVSAAAGTCPTCGMPLSRRTRAAAPTADDAAPGRITLSPMRVAQAGIRTEEVQARPLTLEVGGTGVVRFDEARVRRISAGFAGRVVSIEGTVEGARRSKDSVLLRLLSREVRRALQNYNTAVSQVEDADAKSAAGASQRLRDQVVNTRREALELGVDPVEMAGDREAPDPFEDIPVRAPFDCVVVRLEVRADEQFAPGAPLVEVADREALIAELRVPRAEGRLLRPGLTTEVFDPLDPDARFPARVVRVADAVDASTQSAVVRLKIDKGAERLAPGTSVAATIRVPLVELDPWRAEKASGILTVPESAVVDTGRARIVYVESAPGVFDAREVVLGPRVGAFYPVIRGVAAGARVATAGSFLLDAESRFSQ